MNELVSPEVSSNSASSVSFARVQMSGVGGDETVHFMRDHPAEQEEDGGKQH